MPVCVIAGPEHRPVPSRPGSLGGSPEENHTMQMPKKPLVRKGRRTRDGPPIQGVVAHSRDSSLVRALPELREKIQRAKGAEGSEG